jgi:hypothetical protein
LLIFQDEILAWNLATLEEFIKPARFARFLIRHARETPDLKFHFGKILKHAFLKNSRIYGVLMTGQAPAQSAAQATAQI